MSETLEQAAEAARQAIEKLNALGETWRAKAYQLTRQRELPKGETDGHYIDGHPIEYWHKIATSTLKTNNTLIDRLKEEKKARYAADEELQAIGKEMSYDGETAFRFYVQEVMAHYRSLIEKLREKERINADLEQKVEFLRKDDQQTAMKLNQLQRDLIHQQGCAKTAQDERDTALQELDAMREKAKINHGMKEMRYVLNNGVCGPVEISRENAHALMNGWTADGIGYRTIQEREGFTYLETI